MFLSVTLRCRVIDIKFREIHKEVKTWFRGFQSKTDWPSLHKVAWWRALLSRYGREKLFIWKRKESSSPTQNRQGKRAWVSMRSTFRPPSRELCPRGCITSLWRTARKMMLFPYRIRINSNKKGLWWRPFYLIILLFYVEHYHHVFPIKEKNSCRSKRKDISFFCWITTPWFSLRERMHRGHWTEPRQG